MDRLDATFRYAACLFSFILLFPPLYFALAPAVGGTREKRCLGLRRNLTRAAGCPPVYATRELALRQTLLAGAVIGEGIHA